MMKSKFYLLTLLFLAVPAFASDWYITWHSPQSLMIDKESIVDGSGGLKTFWTLFAPQVEVGKAGEGYAYNKRMHAINCTARTAAVTDDIYYDENQLEHVATVENKGPHNIVPDTQDDFLWKYVCKPEQQEKLGATVGEKGIKDYLATQAKYLRENIAYMRQIHPQ